MKITKLSVDFDNIVFDLEGRNIKEVKDIYDYDLKTREIAYWDYYYDHFPEVTKIWFDFAKYSQGKFFEGDIKFIQALKDTGLEVQIVTASAESISEEKDLMIYERYGDIRVIHTKHKSEVTGNSILIDDGPHNIDCHIETHKLPAIIMDRDYGWSKNYTNELVTKVKNYEETLSTVHKIIKG